MKHALTTKSSTWHKLPNWNCEASKSDQSVQAELSSIQLLWAHVCSHVIFSPNPSESFLFERPTYAERPPTSQFSNYPSTSTKRRSRIAVSSSLLCFTLFIFPVNYHPKYCQCVCWTAITPICVCVEFQTFVASVLLREVEQLLTEMEEAQSREQGWWS